MFDAGLGKDLRSAFDANFDSIPATGGGLELGTEGVGQGRDARNRLPGLRQAGSENPGFDPVGAGYFRCDLSRQ